MEVFVSYIVVPARRLQQAEQSRGCVFCEGTICVAINRSERTRRTLDKMYFELVLLKSTSKTCLFAIVDFWTERVTAFR